MEKVGFSDRKSVINVLTEGKELANELKRQLHPATTSTESCDALVESILSSYENALVALLTNCDSSQFSLTNLFQSPISIEGSPTSEGSNQDSKDQLHKSKKRKTLPKWSEQVRVSSGIGSEGQLDDGYNWRKYGQKDILGANHPRAYYRCTHRNTQGCLATKQVQRADDDPSIFEVIYRGKHSCRQEKLKQKKQNETMIMSLETQTQTRVFDHKEEDHFASFSFPSTPIESPSFFSETSNFVRTSFSPLFLSPETSESYFSLSPCPVSDFGEIISNPTPVLDFPFGDLDFSIDQVNFTCDFFDACDGFQ